MRIAIISPEIYPCVTGGYEIFNYYFIKELATQGHEIWVMSRNEYDWNNKNIHHVKLLGKHFEIAMLSLFFKLIRLKNKIDIIHVPCKNDSYYAFTIFFVKKLIKIPYIITIHSGNLNKWKLKKPMQLFIKNADAIVGVSDLISKEFETRSDKKIQTILPLIPFTEAKIPKIELKKKYGFNKDDIIILSLGSIKKEKGSDILLDAFLNLGKEFVKLNNLKLLYVGDGVMRNELEKKVDNIKFHEWVKFFGCISHETVPEMYKLADIYITASFFEGTSIALVEAMFNNLAIIGTNIDGINNILTDKKTALLFEMGNIHDLKKRIIELVEDKKLIKKLGGASKKIFKDSYRFDEVIFNHKKIMYDVVGDKK
jgi:glycosyltransferase involved in cell wall biosynthesis